MISNFHIKEFSQMMYSPMQVPAGTSILKYFKELGKVKEFRLDPGEGIDNERVMQYVLLMYDKNSPYRKKFNDPLKRKVEVAHDVGFELIEGGVFEDSVEELLRGKNDVVNRKVVQYVILHRSYNYSYQVSVETAYANLMIEIQSGETKGLKNLADMRDDLERNLMEMLAQDNNPYIKNEFLRYMESDRLDLRPEDIALKMQKGETPVTVKSIKG